MTDIVVIGGGAAGLMAALTAAGEGSPVTVLEPNEKNGRKLRITGKGRCNVTNNCEVQEFFKAVRSNPRFLRSALYAFPPDRTMEFFEGIGVPLKTERGNRVFPISDNANDVADALEKEAKRLGVRFRRERCTGLLTENGAVTGVRTSSGTIPAGAVILCTGGASYPGTGSTGDGYRFAKSVGHTIVPPRPSLVPLVTESIAQEMQGLSLRNVMLTLFRGDKIVYREQGEMLFTHFGVSGPLVLSASAMMAEENGYRIEIDLKPALDEEKLDERLLRDFSENKNRDFQNALDALLPQKMISAVIRRSGIDPRLKVNSITREQRQDLRRQLKHFTLEVTGKRGLEEAIVTAGGVSVDQIDPRTMGSRLIRGLYFAGEIMDVDAYTGGFNLQIAWSTAVLAGRASAKENS